MLRSGKRMAAIPFLLQLPLECSTAPGCKFHQLHQRQKDKTQSY
jgi:hypothetical protein